MQVRHCRQGPGDACPGRTLVPNRMWSLLRIGTLSSRSPTSRWNALGLNWINGVAESSNCPPGDVPISGTLQARNKEITEQWCNNRGLAMASTYDGPWKGAGNAREPVAWGVK